MRERSPRSGTLSLSFLPAEQGMTHIDRDADHPLGMFRRKSSSTFPGRSPTRFFFFFPWSTKPACTAALRSSSNESYALRLISRTRRPTTLPLKCLHQRAPLCRSRSARTSGAKLGPGVVKGAADAFTFGCECKYEPDTVSLARAKARVGANYKLDSGADLRTDSRGREGGRLAYRSRVVGRGHIHNKRRRQIRRSLLGLVH